MRETYIITEMLKEIKLSNKSKCAIVILNSKLDIFKCNKQSMALLGLDEGQLNIADPKTDSIKFPQTGLCKKLEKSASSVLVTQKIYFSLSLIDSLVQKNVFLFYVYVPILDLKYKTMGLLLKAKQVIEDESNVDILDICKQLVNLDDVFFPEITHNSYVKYKGLSKRQSECLYHLLHGKTIEEIALSMNISLKTASSYLDTIKFKLNCNSRSDLFLKSKELGFLNFSIPRKKDEFYLNMPSEDFI